MREDRDLRRVGAIGRIGGGIFRDDLLGADCDGREEAGKQQESRDSAECHRHGLAG